MKRIDYKTGLVSLAVLGIALAVCAVARAEKIESVATVFGSERIHVEGFGLVTGLNGTGDGTAGALKLIRQYMEKNQITLDQTDISSKNIALVKIDAEITPFSRPGRKIDVRVTAIDASSLEGGVLSQSPLRARPDGEIYAFASGRILIGSGGRHPTTGIIPANTLGGGQVMKLMPSRWVEDDNKFRLNLVQHSFADAAAIARSINSSDTLNPYRSEQVGFGPEEEVKKISWAIDGGQVIVQIPPSKIRQKVEFIAEVLNLDVPLARPAKVLFNRQSGTVIVTGEVRVDPVAVSHNNRLVTLEAAVQEPGDIRPVAKNYRLDDEQPRRMVAMEGYRRSLPNIEKLIETLNAMGSTAEDNIAILQKMKAAGALHAELIVE
jgi:flagellar P-ring protein precursor FlgI